MNNKLIKQIRNEWASNVWLFVELLLVSVVMWFIVDYVFVHVTISMQPRGFDTSHCYKIEMGTLTEASSNFIINRTEEENEEDIRQLAERLRLRPEIKALGFGQSSHPYNGSNGSMSVQIDTLESKGFIYRRFVSPGFIEVFRYEGANGETPEQLAQLLTERTLIASEDLFKYSYDEDLTPLIGREAILFGDSTINFRLVASLKPIRYDDYTESVYSKTVLLPLDWYDTYLELCVRLHPDQDVDFIEKIRKDSDSQYRIGNIYIANVKSFKDIRCNYLQNMTNEFRNYTLGIAFLLLNIFIGLLGTFWFRTQHRRSEIALMKSLGATKRSVFIRLITEGFIILCIATIPAIVIDFNIAKAELNAWRNLTTLEPGRFIITVCISFALIALMMLIGIWIPARRAMKIQPAEALHDE